MTDLETIKDMLKRASIEFKENAHEFTGAMISVERGYSGFVSEFTFDQNGKLTNLEAVE